MSNLTPEQIRNLESEGYVIRERGDKTDIYKETDYGVIRYNMENGRVTSFDSYYGNLRDTIAHDMCSSNPA